MSDQRERILPLDSFLFPRIFQAFRMSIQPSKLILAFAALAVICLTGWLMDSINPTVVTSGGMTELDAYRIGVPRQDDRVLPPAAMETRTGVFRTLWNFDTRHLHSAVWALFELNFRQVIGSILACFVALVWAFRYHTIYSLIFFAIVLAAMSLAGGAICRIAAMQFARGERPGLTAAVRFSVRKFPSFFTAPITPMIIILVLGAVIMLLGLWGNIPVVGELSVGLLLPFAFAAAAIIAVIAIGTLAGFSLMFPTIAYEDAECFDAISHSFSYVYAKPWRAGFYMVVAFVYGAIGYVFVRFFAFLLLWITYAFLQAGFMRENEKLHAIWQEPTFGDLLGVIAATGDWSTSAAVFLVYFWALIVVGLVVAFVISFYFSASTIIYALLRKRVDLIPIEDIYTYPEDASAEPVAAQAATQQSPTEGRTPSATGPGEKAETSE